VSAARPPGADAHGAWSNFASALAERHVVVRETPAAAHLLHRPQLRASVHGDDLVVPPPSVADAPRALLRLVVMRQLIGGAVPAIAAARSPLWRRAFRTLELRRVDAAIARDYPGARPDLLALRAQTLAGRPARAPPSAMEALLRWALGAPPDAAVEMALHDPLDTALDSAHAASRLCETWWPGWSARYRIDDRGSAPDRALEAPFAGADDAGAAPTTPSPDVALPPWARSRPGAPGNGTLADALADSASGSQAVPDRVPTRARTRVLPSAPARLSAHEPPAGRAHAVDEWDWHAQRFLPGWCTLYEQPLHGRDTGFIHGVRRRHAALAREVHRRLAALRPEALLRVHGADDGDELELDRVIEALVERRAGRTHDRALYLRRDRAQRDVCAAFLVDTSASTDFVLRDPNAHAHATPAPAQDDEVYLYAGALASAAAQQPPPRRVIDVAKETLALMCHALQALGDRFAVYAFSGQGRAQVEFRVVKQFDNAVTPHTAAALSALRPQGATRAGAAIRHASALLARQPQRHKVLIVVSDGYPEDIDYGPEPRDLRYAIEDTAHALREAQALGIDSFNLSIDPAGHDYLRRMCPHERYMVIADVAALPGELTKVYQAMTRAAA
jgi:nitric oxide reductase NorD protein